MGAHIGFVCHLIEPNSGFYRLLLRKEQALPVGTLRVQKPKLQQVARHATGDIRVIRLPPLGYLIANQIDQKSLVIGRVVV